MKRNYKNEAIDIIARLTPELAAQICVNLAKVNPAALVRATHLRIWEAEARHLYLVEDKKIAAINHVRNYNPHMTLKVARDLVESWG